jgi:hypothetical protein
VVLCFLPKVLSQANRIDTAQRPGPITAGGCFAERAAGNVGSENRRAVQNACFVKQDGERVRFLARSATGAPRADEVLRAAKPLQRRQHVRGDPSELLGVSKKVRLPDRHLRHEIIERSLARAQPFGKIVDPRDLGAGHRAPARALEILAPMPTKAEPGPGGKDARHALEGGIGPRAVHHAPGSVISSSSAFDSASVKNASRS